jgi:TetR/AcrR family tetracycline transcriptional repressor
MYDKMSTTMVLKKEQITHMALQLLDEHGLEHLTIRKVARALQVQPGALYWHITSKQELLDTMAEAMMVEVASVKGLTPGQSWDQWLVTVMNRLLGALLSHRDGAAVIMGTNPNNVAAYAQFSDAVIATLVADGVDAADAYKIVGVASVYTLGIALMQGSPVSSGKEKQAHSMQTLFDTGLQLILDGAKH